MSNCASSSEKRFSVLLFFKLIAGILQPNEYDRAARDAPPPQRDWQHKALFSR